MPFSAVVDVVVETVVDIDVAVVVMLDSMLKIAVAVDNLKNDFKKGKKYVSKIKTKKNYLQTCYLSIVVADDTVVDFVVDIVAAIGNC